MSQHWGVNIVVTLSTLCVLLMAVDAGISSFSSAARGSFTLGWPVARDLTPGTMTHGDVASFWLLESSDNSRST
jgi:hypothetical protein